MSLTVTCQVWESFSVLGPHLCRFWPLHMWLSLCLLTIAPSRPIPLPSFCLFCSLPLGHWSSAEAQSCFRVLSLIASLGLLDCFMSVLCVVLDSSLLSLSKLHSCRTRMARHVWLFCGSSPLFL